MGQEVSLILDDQPIASHARMSVFCTLLLFNVDIIALHTRKNGEVFNQFDINIICYLNQD